MNTTEFSSTDWTLLFEDMDRKEEIIYNFFSYVTRLSHSNPQLKYDAGWWVKKYMFDEPKWIQYIPEETVDEFETLLVLREL